VAIDIDHTLNSFKSSQDIPIASGQTPTLAPPSLKSNLKSVPAQSVGTPSRRSASSHRTQSVPNTFPRRAWERYLIERGTMKAKFRCLPLPCRSPSNEPPKR